MYRPYTYKVQHKVTGEFYIGSKYAKGTSPETSEEYLGSVSGNNPRSDRYKHLLDNDRDSLVKEIIFVGQTKEEVINTEILLHQAWFDHPLCLNGAKQTSTKFSFDSSGVKLSEEHRKKIGDNNRVRGVTEETRVKISKSMSGENHHMFGKTGKQNPMFGRKQSDETRAKMRASHTKRKILQQDQQLIGENYEN